MIPLSIKVNGGTVPHTETSHPHARPQDLFVEILTPLKGGDDLTYEGVIPGGIDSLWVQFPFENWKGEVSSRGTLLFQVIKTSLSTQGS